MQCTGRRLLKALALLTALGAGSVMAYLQHPLFGQTPEAGRLSRLTQSPNYADGRFHNQIDTPMRTTDQSEWSMWMENLFGEKPLRRPIPLEVE